MSDLISREALIEKVKRTVDMQDVYLPIIFIDIARNMQTVKAKEWIPCRERLPKDNKPCLCWVESTTIASGETFIIGSCSNGFWFLQTYEIGTHSFPVKDYKVVAWQPLPESYKGEQHETD